MGFHRQLSTVIACILATSAVQLTDAAEFVVTHASFTDNRATYTLKAIIDAQDTAGVSISEADANRRARIFSSLTTSAGVNVGVVGDRIEILVGPAAAMQTATFSFSRDLTPDDAVEIRHRLDIGTKKLTTVIAVEDGSQTATKWVNAAIEVSLHSGKVTASGINLAAGRSIVVPSMEFSGYSVNIEEAEYLRTGDTDSGTKVTSVYNVISVSNDNKTPNAADIPAGAVFVTDGTTTLHQRILPHGIPLGEAADVFTAVEPDLSVSVTSGQTEFIEGIDLSDATLVTRQWNATKVDVTNRTDRTYTIRFGDKSGIDHISRPEPKPQLSSYEEKTRSDADPQILNLLDIGDNSKLANLRAAVKVIIKTTDEVDNAVLEQIKRKYKALAEARTSVAALTAALGQMTDVLDELRATPGADREAIRRVDAAVQRIAAERAEAEKREPTILEELTQVLLP